MLINSAISAGVIDVAIDKGVLKSSLKYNHTLVQDASGMLGVRERILTPSNLEFSFSDPLQFDLDTRDEVGGHVSLKTNPDDFKLDDQKRLSVIEPSWKGFGALKVGRVSDDMDDWLDFLDDNVTIPKLSAIRLQTSSDFSQATGKLHISPKGIVGSVCFYSLDGLNSDESLYYNQIGNILHVPRIQMQPSSLLTENHVPTKAYVAQFYQSAAGLSGIDVLPEVLGTNRRELRVRCDIGGAVFLDPSAGGALDVRVDGIGIVKKAGVLSLNLLGDEDADIVVQGNVIRSITTFAAPFLTKAGNTVSFNLIVESPDLTLVGNTLTCNIDAAPAGGLVKAGSLFSLAPEKLQQLDDATQELTDQKEALENVNEQLTETTQKVSDAVSDITDVKSGLENVAGQVGDLAETIMSTAAQIGTAAAAGAVGGGVSSGLALTAAGKLAKDGVQNLISANAAKVIGGGLAAASLAGILGGLLGSLGGKKTYNTYIIGDQGISNSGVPEGETEPVWGYSISQGFNWDPVKYPNKQTSPMTIGGMLGTALAGTLLASTSPYTGQLTVRGGVGVDGALYASGDAFVNTNQKVATETFVNTNIGNKGFITLANAQSTYQPISAAGSNLTKTGNTISLNADVTLTTMKAIDAQVIRPKAWVQPDMVSLSADGYNLSRSSRASATYDVWRLFDPAQADRWMSTATYTTGVPNAPSTLAEEIEYKGAWVGIESPIPVLLSSFTLTAPSMFLNRTPRDVALLGSTDGITWKLIHTASGINWVSLLEKKTWTLNTNNAKYRFYRLVCTLLMAAVTNDTSITQASLQRWELKGFIDHHTSVATGTDLLPLQTAIDGKQPSGDYANTAALNQALASKQNNLSIATGSPLSLTNSVLLADVYSKGQSDANFYGKASLYTKTEVDGFLSSKQGSGDYATTAALNQALASKQNNLSIATGSPLSLTNSVLSADVYSKAQSDANFYGTASLYTKSEVDTLLGGKQASGDFATNAALTSGLASKQGVLSIASGSPLTLVNNVLTADVYAKASVYTKSEVNAALALKENPLTFNAPLTRSGNTISANLSAYVTQTSLTSQLSSYALKTDLTALNYSFGATLNINSPSPQNYSTNFSVGSATIMQVMSGGVSIPAGSLSIGGNAVATQPWVTSQSFATQTWTNSQGFLKASSISAVSPITWANNTIGLTQSSITKVGTLGATEIISNGGMWNAADGVDMMTALKLRQGTGATYGVALSMDATNLTGGKNWAIWATSGNAGQGHGHLLFTQNGTDRLWLRNDGSMMLTNSPDPSIYLQPGNANPYPYSYGIFMNGQRNGGYGVQLLSCGGAADGFLSIRVATGSSDYTASEVIKATQQRTTLNSQVVVNNITPIFYDMADLRNSTEGAFQCAGEALFHSPVCISGKNVKAHNGYFRYYALAGNGTNSSSGNYSLILGGAGRILCAAGSELNCYSDRREKQGIRTLDSKKALETVSKVRAVRFAYKAVPDQERFGFIAQELLEEVPELISVVSAGRTKEEERYVLNEQGLLNVLWSAFRGYMERADARIKALEEKVASLGK
ncbi:hypothetical protein HK097_008401 [Rhizophlyctis rosea]|uniref:Peptidase S74 domain-containing protein n=1 Tax=Rhizophlyctis rosea TaxID=64517 RepID=A0AAD5SCZ8_9FUNG|nr:hypothetical protein HK097_008401 [Rhizophlyctis rosea]